MKARAARDRFPAAELTPAEIEWARRTERDPSRLQDAHYALLDDDRESTPLSRSIRAVALGRG